MTAKTHIVEQLGETALVLPNLVAAGLRANDRAKYYMSLLQGSIWPDSGSSPAAACRWPSCRVGMSSRSCAPTWGARSRTGGHTNTQLALSRTDARGRADATSQLQPEYSRHRMFMEAGVEVNVDGNTS